MKSMKNTFASFGFATFVLPAAAALSGAAQAQTNVLATVGMVADIAAEIGGDCARVSVLIGPGVDPHDYQPAASDVGNLQSAELILHVGFGLEGRLGSILDRLGETRPVLAVAEAAVHEAALIREDDAGTIDPHLWMDAELWALTVPVIAGALSEAEPACASAIEERAAQLSVKLAALDAWIEGSIASIPEGQRTLVTAHDAFSYYVLAYGLDAAEGIEGISTESEASIADIRAVAEIVATQQVPAVFIETTVNPRTIEALVAEVRALGHDVVIGGELYSDALGASGTAEGTYIGMLRANTNAIVSALGGTPLPLPVALSDWAAQWGVAN